MGLSDALGLSIGVGVAFKGNHKGCYFKGYRKGCYKGYHKGHEGLPRGASGRPFLDVMKSRTRKVFEALGCREE